MNDIFVDNISITETRISPNSYLATPGYRCYRQDKLIGRDQGVAVLIKSDIPHSQLKSPKTFNLERIGVQLNLSGINVSVIPVYQSPNLPLLSSDLDILLSVSPRVEYLGNN